MLTVALLVWTMVFIATAALAALMGDHKIAADALHAAMITGCLTGICICLGQLLKGNHKE